MVDNNILTGYFPYQLLPKIYSQPTYIDLYNIEFTLHNNTSKVLTALGGETMDY